MTARDRSTLPPLLLGAVLLFAVALARGPVPPVPEEPTLRPVDTARTMPALRAVALPPPPAVEARETPAPTSVGAALRPSAADIGRGHLLLDRIDKGEGPAIEIAWPTDPAARRALLAHLRRCAGWRVLLLSGGRLWRLGDPPGRPWTPAGGASPSGVLRDLDGVVGDGAGVAAIRARHGLVGGGAVAVVDRRWDARLLGGLDRLVGEDPVPGTAVRARYAIGGGRLTVDRISLGDRPIAGRVDLGPMSRCEP